MDFIVLMCRVMKFLQLYICCGDLFFFVHYYLPYHVLCRHLTYGGRKILQGLILQQTKCRWRKQKLDLLVLYFLTLQFPFHLVLSEYASPNLSLVFNYLSVVHALKF